jgi:hypothetical protein
MASEVLMTISKDEIEQARLMSEWKYEMDTQSRLVEAERKGRKQILELMRQGYTIDQIEAKLGEDSQA